MTNFIALASVGILLLALCKSSQLSSLSSSNSSQVVAPKKTHTQELNKLLDLQHAAANATLTPKSDQNPNGFDLPIREELDLLDYIEKLNVKYKNFSAPDSVFEERKQTNLQETTIEIVKQLITAPSKIAASTTTAPSPAIVQSSTSSSPATVVANNSSSTASQEPSKANAHDLAASDNEPVESSWQYGIFDRFTRARSTTSAPTTPEPATIDVRSLNSEECGLKFYAGDYNTGKVGDYNVAAAPGSPFDDSASYSAPSSVANTNTAANAREKYTADKQHKLQESYLQSPQVNDDDGYSHPHSNHNQHGSDASNSGLRPDWNKELFGHEEAYNNRPPYSQSSALSGSSSGVSDSDFNLSSKRNWRQQQLGQTLQHLGFDVSELMSMRSQQSPRENLMKVSSAKAHKSEDGAQSAGAAAINQNIREPVESLKLEPRVIGGTDARLGDSPWAVSLQALVSRPGTGAVEYRHYCGGTLISERYVLTAAHCLDFMVGRESRLFVVVGDLQWRMTPSSTFGKRIPVEKLTIHAGYKSTAFGHDIGLIKLKEPVYPVKANGRYIVNSVCLPERNIEHTGDAELVGWGLFSNRNEMADTLQIATVPILPRPLCVDLYRRRTGLIQWIIGIELITEKQVCASTFGRGICQGDSGSPLVFNERLRRFMPENGSVNSSAIGSPQSFSEHTRSTIIGIVAFGGIRRCSYQSLPGVYMQTSKYMDWILPKIK